MITGQWKVEGLREDRGTVSLNNKWETLHVWTREDLRKRENLDFSSWMFGLVDSANYQKIRLENDRTIVKAEGAGADTRSSALKPSPQNF